MTNPQVESLLEHDSFLRAMARRLLGDDVAADDVVQEAWLVALKSAKRPEDVRAGWLLGIVKNLVRRTRRDGERRMRRERTAARTGSVTPTDEACAERALRRKIAEIVIDLPAIYREPLLLRYYDGLTPQAIAERLALKGSTVRTRIQRGLLRVRARLENGNGRSLSVALAAIAAPRPLRGVLRAAVVAAALAVAVLLARTPPPSPLRTAYETATASAASATPFAGDATVALSPAAGTRGPQGDAPLLLEGIVHLPQGAVETTVRLELDGLPADIRGDAPFAIAWAEKGPLRVRAVHAESEPLEVVVHVPGRMELHLRRRALVPGEKLLPERAGEEGEALAAGEEGATLAEALKSLRAPKGIALEGVVRLPPGASTRPVLLEAWRTGGARVRVFARGGARFSLGVATLLLDPRPLELRLRASHPDAAPRETDVAVLFDPLTGAPVLPFVEIELLGAAFLEGVVELEGFGPAADATVAVFPYEGDAPAAEFAAAARTRADGSFRLAVDRGATYFVAAAAPGYAPAGAAAVAEADTALPTLVLRSGVAITGSVRSGEAAAAGATVRASVPETSARTLSLSLDGNAIAYDAGGVAWRSLAAEANGDGTFRIPGLAARTYRVEVLALLDGEAPRYGALEVAAPGIAEFDVPVARVSVTVRGGGAPLAGASVEALRADGSSLSRVTDATGRALLLARPSEALRLAVAAEGFAAEEREVRAETSEIPFDLVPEKRTGTIVVALRSEQGVALPSACEFDLTPDRGRAVRRKTIVEEGRFVLKDLEPAVYRVVATLPGNFLAASGRVALRRGETVDLSLDVRAGGRIVVRILTKDKLPDVWVEGAGDYGSEAFGGSPAWRVTGDTLESGLMAPGFYVLHVLAPDGPRSFPVDVKPGETVRLLVPLG